MRTAVVLLVLLTSAPLAAQDAAPGKHAPAARKIRFNGRELGPSDLASDGTTTCVSTPSYSRCTGE